MTQAEPSKSSTWLTATVISTVMETPRVKRLTLDAPGWPGHVAGQHLDVRLTADDGYQAQRSYSIASAPEAPHLELAIERVDGGEVSDYLAGEARAGDQFEIRGPIGRYFVWTVAERGPLYLIAGGSGIAPLMSILRHVREQAFSGLVTLLYSSRGLEEIIYRAELEEITAAMPNVLVVHTLSRSQPEGWRGGRRRIDRDLLARVGFAPADHPRIFICGSNPLVEDVSRLLVDLGHDPLTIKTERFGPTGAPQ